MTDFNTAYPSVRQIQTCIKDATPVEFKLLTGDILVGKVLWQDPLTICLAETEGKEIFVSRQAIAYIKPQG